MDYFTVGDNQSLNTEFIANSDYQWWWTDHILPLGQQDPWVQQNLFVDGTDRITYHPWGKYIEKIKEGQYHLLDEFILFPFLYQAVQHDGLLHFPATTCFPSYWFSTGQHKLVVWNLLGRKFDLPILWQTPRDIVVQNATQLTCSQQLIDRLAPRLGPADKNKRIFFHIRNGVIVNLTLSINWKNPWNEIKSLSRDSLLPVIKQLVMQHDKNSVEELLIKVCNIKTQQFL